MNSRYATLGVAVSVLTASIACADFNTFSWSLSENGLSGTNEFSLASTYDVLGSAAVGGSGTVDSITMTVVGGNSNVRGMTWYSTTASADGVVSVDWAFLAQPGADIGGWDAGGYVLNGVFQALALNSNAPASGVLSFAVSAGDVFGFGTATADGLFGASTTSFTNFSFIPAPGAIGLLALAGLAGHRRRR
jgi:hypothetical protein